jgi:hypothetical protein
MIVNGRIPTPESGNTSLKLFIKCRSQRTSISKMHRYF